jgi:hypothetical protein
MSWQVFPFFNAKGTLIILSSLSPAQFLLNNHIAAWETIHESLAILNAMK